MSIGAMILSGLLLVVAWMAVAFIVQRARNDAGIVDVARTVAIGLLALLYGSSGDGYSARRFVLIFLVCLWAGRLAGHLVATRMLGGQVEDGRYRRWRKKWGADADRNFFLWFQLQGAIAFGLSLPLLVVALCPAMGFRGWDLAGGLVWLVAILGESAADAQLAAWRKDPGNAGKACRTGLWRFSRHPNYFFECLHWCAYILLGFGFAEWPITFLGPGIALWTLLQALPRTEEQALVSRPIDYRDYQWHTGRLVPGLPAGWLAKTGIDWAERRKLSDRWIARGIHRMLEARVFREDMGSCEARRDSMREKLASLTIGPILHPAAAKLPALPQAFWERVLGPRALHACAFWTPGTTLLEEAEESMLHHLALRAQVADGMEVLEWGFGWGALAVWIAEKHPKARVLAVLDSFDARHHVENEAARRGLKNLEAVSADLDEFKTDRTFDRIVSLETLERVHNWEELLRRADGWLKSSGKLFAQLFVHRMYTWRLDTAGEDAWLARHFLPGAVMPSDDLLHFFQRDLVIEEQWCFSGKHYERTARAWLANLDARWSDLLPLLRSVHGAAEAERWLQRWRIYFLVRAGMGGYRQGEEWWISQYRLAKRT